MFWNKKNKPPITVEDKLWLEEALQWLRSEFGDAHFNEIKTVTPTKTSIAEYSMALKMMRFSFCK